MITKDKFERDLYEALKAKGLSFFSYNKNDDNKEHLDIMRSNFVDGARWAYEHFQNDEAKIDRFSDNLIDGFSKLLSKYIGNPQERNDIDIVFRGKHYKASLKETTSND